MPVPERRNSSRYTGTLSDVRVPLTVPQSLASQIARIAERDCSTIAATTRRLLARSVKQELAIAEVR